MNDRNNQCLERIERLEKQSLDFRVTLFFAGWNSSHNSQIMENQQSKPM